MSSDALFILALTPVLLWLPISWFFLQNWRRRKNPISMASAIACFGGVYITLILDLAIGHLSKTYIIGGLTTLTSITAFNFHWSIRAAEDYKDSRKDVVP